MVEDEDYYPMTLPRHVLYMKDFRLPVDLESRCSVRRRTIEILTTVHLSFHHRTTGKLRSTLHTHGSTFKRSFPWLSCVWMRVEQSGCIFKQSGGVFRTWPGYSILIFSSYRNVLTARSSFSFLCCLHLINRQPKEEKEEGWSLTVSHYSFYVVRLPVGQDINLDDIVADRLNFPFLIKR